MVSDQSDEGTNKCRSSSEDWARVSKFGGFDRYGFNECIGRKGVQKGRGDGRGDGRWKKESASTDDGPASLSFYGSSM